MEVKSDADEFWKAVIAWALEEKEYLYEGAIQIRTIY